MNQLQKELARYASSQKQKIATRFFKTAKGEYGEGDKFIGIVVPDIRKVAKKYQAASFLDIMQLLHSPVHEERLCALLILVTQYKVGDIKKKKQIFQVYLKNTKYINNWDLVELTAPNIVGAYLLSQNHPSDSHLPASKRKKLISNQILYKLVQSKSLWERRIAILATFAFIRAKQFTDAIKIA